VNKTTEALELAEALENDAKEHREVSYGLDCPPERTANWKHALNCEAAARLIREALAEPVKQEPVMDYEHICALRESEQIQAGDSYFFVRPENDTPTSRKMFFQGFERGFHKGLKYAAQVSAKREWVELTDDELKAALEVHQVGLSIRIGRIAIAAFKEKNK